MRASQQQTQPPVLFENKTWRLTRDHIECTVDDYSFETGRIVESYPEHSWIQHIATRVRCLAGDFDDFAECYLIGLLVLPLDRKIDPAVVRRHVQSAFSANAKGKRRVAWEKTQPGYGEMRIVPYAEMNARHKAFEELDAQTPREPVLPSGVNALLHALEAKSKRT